MIVACEHCQRRYSIDESRLKPGQTLFKCDSCKNVIKVDIPEPGRHGKDDSAADHSLTRAIQLIQGHKLREGRKMLIEAVRNDPHNTSGWIWLIRTGQNFEEIDATLAKGLQLFPETPDLIAEQRKISAAKTAATNDNGQLRHCPFCWAPMSTKVFKCPVCNSYLVVLKSLSLPVSGGDEHILTEAKEALAKLPDLQTNSTALYFLAMAALNLGDTLEAVSMLRQAATLGQQSKFFVEQMQTLDSLIEAYSPKPAGSDHGPEEPQLATGAPDAVDRSKEAASKTILVVEDSITTRKVIVNTLSKIGYNVIEAADGLEALSKLNAHKPDLVLLDIILPKMDGYKLLSIIKDDETGLSKTPVIMLTSKDGMLNKLKGKVAGSAAYLTKPFDLKVLIETIEKNL